MNNIRLGIDQVQTQGTKGFVAVNYLWISLLLLIKMIKSARIKTILVWKNQIKLYKIYWIEEKIIAFEKLKFFVSKIELHVLKLVKWSEGGKKGKDGLETVKTEILNC